MKRGDTYTNFGGEHIKIDYIESRAWISSTTRLIVRGVDYKDISNTLETRVGEFLDCKQPEIVIYTDKYRKTYRKEQKGKTQN